MRRSKNEVSSGHLYMTYSQKCGVQWPPLYRVLSKVWCIVVTFIPRTLGKATQINRETITHVIPRKVSFDGDTVFQRFLDLVYLEN